MSFTPKGELGWAAGSPGLCERGGVTGTGFRKPRFLLKDLLHCTVRSPRLNQPLFLLLLLQSCHTTGVARLIRGIQCFASACCHSKGYPRITYGLALSSVTFPSPKSLLGLQGLGFRTPTRACLSGDSALRAQEKVREKNVKLNATAGSSK